ncbi:hypothetical protein C8Q69DRAFT_525256, partial [Paecilomyces variotii]
NGLGSSGSGPNLAPPFVLLPHLPSAPASSTPSAFQKQLRSNTFCQNVSPRKEVADPCRQAYGSFLRCRPHHDVRHQLGRQRSASSPEEGGVALNATTRA